MTTDSNADLIMTIAEIGKALQSEKETQRESFALCVEEFQLASNNAAFQFNRCLTVEDIPVSVPDVRRAHDQLKLALTKLRDLCDQHISSLADAEERFDRR